MRISASFQDEGVHTFSNKGRNPDRLLSRAVRDAERGLIAADLGGGIIKQRIARPGQGKSGGFRTLIVFRLGARAIFVHGFAKNQEDNIDRDELAALKKLAAELLAYDDKTITLVIASGILVEV